MTGQWTPQESNGLLTNRSANVSYARFYDSSMDKWFSTQNTISHDDIDWQTRKNAETLPGVRNLIRQSMGQTDTKATVFDSQECLALWRKGQILHHDQPHPSHYQRNRKYTDAYAACSIRPPY